jgi:DNA repair exonuclease SbcCD ATPase subunit
VTYEADLQRFSELYDAYLNTVSAAEAAENKAKEYRKVRDVMNVLRSLIKQHLLPSLNAVSSHLLEKMTGGQRRAIYVDENFDVIVDQQSLDTLSGSGKAVANLALRIALGQVLTNRVFSVLMADEIDASMDNFRAENTAEVLLTLQNSISQILQVSHKSIEATSYVDLGDTSEPTD